MPASKQPQALLTFYGAQDPIFLKMIECLRIVFLPQTAALSGNEIPNLSVVLDETLSRYAILAFGFLDYNACRCHYAAQELWKSSNCFFPIHPVCFRYVVLVDRQLFYLPGQRSCHDQHHRSGQTNPSTRLTLIYSGQYRVNQ